MSKDKAVEDFVRSTTNHTPNEDTIREIEFFRKAVQDLVEILILSVPSSRARSVAITHFEDAIMWSVKSFILRDKDQEDA